VVLLGSGFRNKLGECKLETMKNIIEDSPEQLFIVVPHLDRLVDRVLSVAQQVECAIIKRLVL
jgi:hypothetical protein